MSNDKLDGSNTIIVAGNGQIDIIRITVGINKCDRCDAHLASFADGISFFLGVNHDNALGQPVHVTQTVKVAVHLAVFPVQRGLHFLRIALQLFRTAQFFQISESAHPATDRPEICQRPTEPAFTDKGHAAAERLSLDDTTRLSLGSHEQDQAASFDDLGDILAGSQQSADGFADIDDMELVLASVDIGGHFRIPAACTVTEMDS